MKAIKWAMVFATAFTSVSGFAYTTKTANLAPGAKFCESNEFKKLIENTKPRSASQPSVGNNKAGTLDSK